MKLGPWRHWLIGRGQSQPRPLERSGRGRRVRNWSHLSRANGNSGCHHACQKQVSNAEGSTQTAKWRNTSWGMLGRATSRLLAGLPEIQNWQGKTHFFSNGCHHWISHACWKLTDQMSQTTKNSCKSVAHLENNHRWQARHPLERLTEETLQERCAVHPPLRFSDGPLHLKEGEESVQCHKELAR